LPALTLRVAVAGPAEAGSNTTLMVQLAPAATDEPQLLVCEKGLEPPVESMILLIVSGTALVFVTVTGFGALAMFVNSLPNASDVGDTL
jgi:hypothetical protein